MPYAAPHPCGKPGCPALVPRGQARCPQHTKAHEIQDRQQRGTSAERGYDAKWRAARRQFIAKNPLCCACMAGGRVTPTFAVDHIVPHRGDQRLFWDVSNWQALCEEHHNAKSSRERLARTHVGGGGQNPYDGNAK